MVGTSKTPSFVLLLVNILVSFVFFLVFFVLKYSIPCLHVSTDGTLSVFHSNFLFGVFGHCKASWMGEMCLSLKPACVAVLVPGLYSRVPRQDQISD